MVLYKRQLVNNSNSNYGAQIEIEIGIGIGIGINPKTKFTSKIGSFDPDQI